uniref:Uncharacterized protein n=1 Tax=Anguilla anguilla TaxID=7936 RepID=A0A0E9X8X4_ANGAN
MPAFENKQAWCFGPKAGMSDKSAHRPQQPAEISPPPHRNTNIIRNAAG